MRYGSPSLPSKNALSICCLQVAIQKALHVLHAAMARVQKTGLHFARLEWLTNMARSKETQRQYRRLLTGEVTPTVATAMWAGSPSLPVQMSVDGEMREVKLPLLRLRCVARWWQGRLRVGHHMNQPPYRTCGVLHIPERPLSDGNQRYTAETEPCVHCEACEGGWWLMRTCIMVWQGRMRHDRLLAEAIPVVEAKQGEVDVLNAALEEAELDVMEFESELRLAEGAHAKEILETNLVEKQTAAFNARQKVRKAQQSLTRAVAKCLYLTMCIQDETGGAGQWVEEVWRALCSSFEEEYLPNVAEPQKKNVTQLHTEFRMLDFTSAETTPKAFVEAMKKPIMADAVAAREQLIRYQDVIRDHPELRAEQDWSQTDQRRKSTAQGQSLRSVTITTLAQYRWQLVGRRAAEMTEFRCPHH